MKRNVSSSSPTTTLPNGNCCRTSRSQMFFKIVVLENFAHFTGKHLRWRLALIKIFKFIKKKLQHRCFPVKFYKFLRTTFFTETPLLAASVGKDILVIAQSLCAKWPNCLLVSNKLYISNFVLRFRIQIILL